MLLWVALVLSIPFYGPSRAYVSGAVVGALLMAAIALAVVGYSRREALPSGVARRVMARMPSRVRPRLERAFDLAGGQVRELLGNTPNLRAATGWSLLNWLLDAASLWVFLLALGWVAHPLGLLVAYGVATLVGMLPLTSGGLGVVEALLIPALVAMGAPQATAVLGWWRGACSSTGRPSRWPGSPGCRCGCRSGSARAGAGLRAARPLKARESSGSCSAAPG